MPRPPNPQWRVPTRPCPFYSQGNCFFAESCNFVHDIKITATPIRIADKNRVLPEISYTAPPMEEEFPSSEPYIVSSSPDDSFLDEDAIREADVSMLSSPGVFTDEPEDLMPPAPQLSDAAANKKLNRSLAVPLYLNELKSYQKTHHMRPSPQTTVQELSYSENDPNQTGLSLLPIAESSLMQHRRSHRDSDVQDSQVSVETTETADTFSTASSLGLSNLDPAPRDITPDSPKHSLELPPADEEPQTSTPPRIPGLRPLRLPTLRSATSSEFTETLPKATSTPDLTLPSEPSFPAIPSPIGPSPFTHSIATSDIDSQITTLSDVDAPSSPEMSGAPFVSDESPFEEVEYHLQPTAVEPKSQHSILDEIYGNNTPMEKAHNSPEDNVQDTLHEDTSHEDLSHENLSRDFFPDTSDEASFESLSPESPYLSHGRPLSMATTESDATAIVTVGKRFSVATIPAARTNSPREPMPDDAILRWSHAAADEASNDVESAIERTASPPVSVQERDKPSSKRGSVSAVQMTPSTSVSSIESSERVTSPEDMYRRLSNASAVERAKRLTSLISILGAIEETEMAPAGPSPAPSRPSSRASSHSSKSGRALPFTPDDDEEVILATSSHRTIPSTSTASLPPVPPTPPAPAAAMPTQRGRRPSSTSASVAPRPRSPPREVSRPRSPAAVVPRAPSPAAALPVAPSPVAVSRPRSPPAAPRPRSPAPVSRSRSPAAVSRPRSPVTVSRPRSPPRAPRSLSPSTVSRPRSPFATAPRAPSPLSRPSLSRRSSQISPLVPTPQRSPIPPVPPSANRRLTLGTALTDDPPPSAHSTIASATPSAQLFFALAADSPEKVQDLLATGQADANDTAGPNDLPALVFSLANDQLKNKTEIVKTLLAHGADPSVVQHLVPNQDAEPDTVTVSDETDDSPLAEKLRDAMNPAIQYYLGRQGGGGATQQQVKALQAGHYDPLLQARYYIVGQDLALEEMMRAVASHSRRKGSVASLALVLTGPSGHGKSHLASKIGTLLQCPMYIVNMTNLRTQEDLMRAKSLARESHASPDLLNFLTTHEGRRCVVILEELEKTAEKQVLHSLLMPWELGKVPASPINPVIDTAEVIWVCTSNSGEQLVFDFTHSKSSETPSSREEYKKLMTKTRAKLADELGASIVSRVQGVLPFLPFTHSEQRALASEMLDKLASQELEATYTWLTTAVAEEIVNLAVEDYMEREGARSIHRAVQDLYEERMMETVE